MLEVVVLAALELTLVLVFITIALHAKNKRTDIRKCTHSMLAVEICEFRHSNTVSRKDKCQHVFRALFLPCSKIFGHSRKVGKKLPNRRAKIHELFGKYHSNTSMLFFE